MSDVPTSNMGAWAMQKLALQHPELTFHQLVKMMTEAQWKIGAETIECLIVLPVDEKVVKIEIKQQADDKW